MTIDRFRRIALAVPMLGVLCLVTTAHAAPTSSDGAAESNTKVATTKMPSITIIAQITALPGHEDQMLAALQADEKATLAKEPGCKTFQVLVREGHPAHFVLFENYDDMAAFDRHRAQPHFAAFEAAVKAHGAGAPVIHLLSPAQQAS